MKKHFIAAVYAEGAHGGIITLKDDGFYFTAHKIMTVPARYAKVMFPYEEIENFSFNPIAHMGGVYPAVTIVLKNGKQHDFLISNPKRFFKYMHIMCCL